jgi:hypothetical protein
VQHADTAAARLEVLNNDMVYLACALIGAGVMILLV